MIAKSDKQCAIVGLDMMGFVSRKQILFLVVYLLLKVHNKLLLASFHDLKVGFLIPSLSLKNLANEKGERRYEQRRFSFAYV